MESNSNQRRRIKNLILNRGQLRQLVPYAILSILTIVLCAFMYWITASCLSEILAALTPDQSPVVNRIYETDSQLMEIFLGGSVLSMMLAGLFWLLYSHRVTGPTVQLTRQINNMIEGHFEEVHLRQKDELKEVADGLNRLCNKLSGDRLAGK